MYELVVDIFDTNNNRIYPSDNVVIEFGVDKVKFAVRQKTSNGTYHKGTPLTVGTAEVTATLLGVKDEDGRLVELDPPLHATGQLLIFDEISLDPRISVFPWDPLSNPFYSIK